MHCFTFFSVSGLSPLVCFRHLSLAVMACSSISSHSWSAAKGLRIRVLHCLGRGNRFVRKIVMTHGAVLLFQQCDLQNLCSELC